MPLRILFDQDVPICLRRLLVAHDVTLASQLGWAQIANGELIAEADRVGLDVLVTADRNLPYQQTLTNRRLAIVVLTTNPWKTLRDQSDRVVLALDRVGATSFEEVVFDRPRASPDR